MELADKEAFPQIFALMEQSFPPSEYRCREEQAALWRRPAYRVYIARAEDGKITGFLAAWEFDSFRFAEHLAVDPAARGGGLGGKMFREYLNRDPRPVFLEVEPPETDIARRRIAFYQRLGVQLNRFDYWQQPLRKGDAPMPLLVMSWPKPVPAQDFEPYKRMIYREVYGVVENGKQQQ